MSSAAVSFVLLCLCFTFAFAAPLTVHVGGLFYLSSASGAADSTGLSRYAAMIAAIQDINGNTRYNTAITLQAAYCDTKRQASQAASCATSVYTQNQSSVLVTGLTTPETQAIFDLNLPIPVLASGANAPTFSNSTAYPLFLRDIPNGTDQTKCLAAIINQKGAGIGVAGVYTSDDAATSAIGTSLFSRLQTHTPAPTILGVLTGLPGNNASAAVQFLNSSSAQIWPLISQANDISTVAGAINSAGITTSRYIAAGPDSMLSSSLFSAAGSQAAMQNGFACVLSTPTGSAYDEFVTSYARVQAGVGAPAVPESKAVYTYDLLYMIAEAYLAVINSAQNTSSPTALMNALRAVNFTGASGQIYFTAGSNDIAVAKAYDVQQVKGAAFPTVGSYSQSGALSLTSNFTFPFSSSTTSTSGSSSNATSTVTSSTSTSTSTSSASFMEVSVAVLFLALISAVMF